MEFAQKNHYQFDPKRPSGLVMDAAATAYTTPAVFGVKLAGLVTMKYLTASLPYRLELNQASAGGSADIQVKAGGAVLGSATVDLSSGTDLTGTVDVDLVGVGGAQAITVTVEVTSAADAGTTASLDARLDVETPVVLSGC